MKKNYFRVCRYKYDPKDKDSEEYMQESEANYFAMSLLMPEGKMKKLIGYGASLENMADYFGVSEGIISNRIRWLVANRKDWNY